MHLSFRYRERLEQICSSIQPPRDNILKLVNLQAQQETSTDHGVEFSCDSEEMDALCSALDKQRRGLQILTDEIA